ncbi:MAG TPA: hypothetical protein VLE73_04685 [Candidatus Saccharimonadales bacterium]|nr:hypothetical protein [Candidatus Saccharimonadales bacterium]
MAETAPVYAPPPRRLHAVPEAPIAPIALEAASLPMEEWVQAQFKRRFLGAIGLRQTVETVESPDNPTLAHSIGLAVEGNAEAAKLVDINIATATAEVCFKDDYATRVTKQVDEAGEITQFGLTGHQMHLNSYALRPNRPAKLKEFTLAEALNGYREQACMQSGLLDDHILLVASCVPEDMSEEDLDYRGDGYFTRTMSYSLQATTSTGGEVVTETGFQRGTAAEETASYEERQAQRYDLEAIGMIYESLGFDAPKTALEFLQRPLLLKKSEFPNGLLDVLRRCDIAADVLQDVVRERDISEYLDLFDRSAAREATLGEVRSRARSDLFAAAGTFKEAEDATRLLWDSVRDHAVQDAGHNEAIDAIAFGPLAAGHIAKARKAHAAGDERSRDLWVAGALEVATASGCGGGSCGIREMNPSSEIGSTMGVKLDWEPGDRMEIDDVRCCVKCNVGKVVYVYNQRGKLNKGCTRCPAVEINGQQQK